MSLGAVTGCSNLLTDNNESNKLENSGNIKHNISYEQFIFLGLLQKLSSLELFHKTVNCTDYKIASINTPAFPTVRDYVDHIPEVLDESIIIDLLNSASSIFGITNPNYNPFSSEARQAFLDLIGDYADGTVCTTELRDLVTEARRNMNTGFSLNQFERNHSINLFDMLDDEYTSITSISSFINTTKDNSNFSPEYLLALNIINESLSFHYENNSLNLTDNQIKALVGIESGVIIDDPGDGDELMIFSKKLIFLLIFLLWPTCTGGGDPPHFCEVCGQPL
jgi:hypothetical protein